MDTPKMPSEKRLKFALLLTLFLLWCAALVFFRIIRTRSLGYGFLIPNLFLAALPLFFSTAVTLSSNVRWKISFGAFWLLFFPNAPYIITDLVHLSKVGTTTLWYDILLVTSCACAGLAMGYASLVQIHNELLKIRRPWFGWSAVLASSFLAGFGIYLGRFERWHSIDLFRHPIALSADILDRFINPWSHPRTWGVTIGFGIFLTFLYALIRVAGQSSSALTLAHVPNQEH